MYHCGGYEEAQAGRETSISQGVVCNKVGRRQKEAPFDTFILGEGDTAQEAGQEEIPSSSPSLPPHYHLPPPHLPYRSILPVQPHCISVCLRGWSPPWTGGGPEMQKP